MINKKFKPAVAAVMTGAILAGTAAYPMVTESYVQDAAGRATRLINGRIQKHCFHMRENTRNI